MSVLWAGFDGPAWSTGHAEGIQGTTKRASINYLAIWVLSSYVVSSIYPMHCRVRIKLWVCECACGCSGFRNTVHTCCTD